MTSDCNLGAALPVDSGEMAAVHDTLDDTGNIFTLPEAARLRSTFESLTDGFFTLDKKWRFTLMNAAARKCTNLRHEPLGVTLWDQFPETLGTEVERSYRRVMTERVPVDFEISYQPLAIWVRIKAFPCGDGIAVSFADITEAREAQRELAALAHSLENRVKLRTAELESANKDLATFSYTVAHDLRSPLSAVCGFSRAIAESSEQTLGPRSAHHLRRIEAAAKRMDEMTQAILALCDLSRAKLENRLVDLSAIAAECLAGLQDADPIRKVSWTVLPCMWAECDPGLMQVAVQNLVSNAWKYTGKIPHARIEVGTELGPLNQIYFYVRDNGVGFDEAESSNIFAPFYRLREDEFAGSGIGLATVAKIIERHRGRVWAESVPDRGATFYFSLGDVPASCEAEKPIVCRSRPG